MHPCIHPDNGNILVSVICATVWFGSVVELAGVLLDWVDVLRRKHCRNNPNKNAARCAMRDIYIPEG